MEKLSTENQKTLDSFSDLEPSAFKAPSFKTLSIPEKANYGVGRYSGVSKSGEKYLIEVEKLGPDSISKAVFTITGIQISFKAKNISLRDVMSKIEAFGYSFKNFTNP